MTELTSQIDIALIRRAMRKPRPGLRGQALMLPSHRIDPELYRKGSEDCRRAAVLLLLYPYQNHLYTLLTVRPQDIPDHPGQVAFPGGAKDEDESVVETALREAKEEVGVDVESIEPIGRLTHLYIPPSHFCIQIVVGYAETRPQWRPNPAEVAQILEVPAAHFFDRRNWQEEIWKLQGGSYLVPYFQIGDHKMWGATAMAMAEFVVMVEDAMHQEASASPT